MRRWVLGLGCGLALSALAGCAQDPLATSPLGEGGYRAALRETLESLAEQSVDPLFQQHFRSVIAVVDAGDRHADVDDRNISRLWRTFEDVSSPDSPRLRESYLNRTLQLIVAWTSPTSGQVSFTWLRLPADWDPEREYPLYIQLHGYWDVAGNRLEYLTYPFLNPQTSFAFEDGYLICPWGRGNLWYQGIAEADVWESIETVKGLVRVDDRRQYLCGHSMGGYGAWHIASRSVDVWAALGVHAGALVYGTDEVTPDVAATLRDLPTYFVIGDADNLLDVNRRAYRLLEDAGNPNLSFLTFGGGHEYRQQDVERMYLWMRAFARE